MGVLLVRFQNLLTQVTALPHSHSKASKTTARAVLNVEGAIGIRITPTAKITNYKSSTQCSDMFEVNYLSLNITPLIRISKTIKPGPPISARQPNAHQAIYVNNPTPNSSRIILIHTGANTAGCICSDIRRIC